MHKYILELSIQIAFDMVSSNCLLIIFINRFVQTLESSFTILNLVSIGCAMIPLTITGFEVNR